MGIIVQTTYQFFIICNPRPVYMTRVEARVNSPGIAILLTALMFLSGCTGAVEDVEEIIENVVDDFDQMSRTLGSPNLEIFQDCLTLEENLKLSIEEEAKTSLMQAVDEIYYYGGWMEDDVLMDGDVAEASGDSGGSSSTPTLRQEGVDFSGTNNQEQGVDEADFVKTDGYHIFFLDSGLLHILDIPEFGNLSLASTIAIDGNPVAMMLDGENNLVVISTVSSWNIDESDALYEALKLNESNNWRTNSLTKFTVLDVSNSSEPTTQRELYIEGHYMTAREVAGTVRTVTHTWMDVPGIRTWLELPADYWEYDYDSPERYSMRVDAANSAIQKNSETMASVELSDIIPQIYEKVIDSDGTDSVITHQMSEDQCSDFTAPEDSLNRGFTSIFTLDLLSTDFNFEADHIVGNWPLVYASQDSLIITENAWDWWWFWDNEGMNEATNIHTFDISEPGETSYTGSGRVDGTILNQFSISEYEGIVRVATTTGQWGRWWMENPEPMQNHVITLKNELVPELGNNALVEKGRVDGIAYNETIWSARFVEDRAYIVTFRNMDPLWTIDLSDYENPKIMGELEVPGVSTYIHPLSDDALLTIGLGPADEETGLGLDWSHTRLSLFDVSNFSDPLAGETLSLTPVSDPDDGWNWAWSEATWEHKAFQYWEPKGMLAVPINTYRYDCGYDSDDNYQCEYQWVSKLIIVNVTEEDLSIHGVVDHSQFYENEDGKSWWNSYNIRRSIFMGDYVYAISHGGVTATNLDTMEESASVELPVSMPYYYYEEEVEIEEVEEEGSSGSSGETSDSGSGSSEGNDDV